MQSYYPPEHNKPNFHCIHCGVYSAQDWRRFFIRKPGVGGLIEHDELTYCVCYHCHESSYWFKGKMVIPCEAPVMPAHVDMPAECIKEYNEARSVFAASPRAASALLRLAVQKLMPVLGESGTNINDDIGDLVKNGLPVQAQMALDFCRVVGNNAVHPGEIDLNDTPEIAHSLFDMINFIVEDRIARPKQINALYSKLPEKAKEAIAARDAGR